MSSLLNLPRIIISGLLFLLSGCASLNNSQIQKVNNQQYEYVIHQGKSPTVIFENGLGGQFHWWAKVFPEISKTQSSLAYHRAGYGRSDVGESPRDAEKSISELRDLLSALHLSPPYILVGHSLGGLYFQYFARKYPNEVVGLVLVDSTHPRQFSGDNSPQNWSWWVKTMVNLLTPKVGLEELRSVSQSGEQVLRLPPLDTHKIKTVILVASEPENPKTLLEQDVVNKRKDFKQLYPGADFITVKGGHGIPLDNPNIVIEQVKKLISMTSQPHQ